MEDAAEALGSHFKKKQVGTYGDIGILSFNGNKIITTGVGGAILTNNQNVLYIKSGGASGPRIDTQRVSKICLEPIRKLMKTTTTKVCITNPVEAHQGSASTRTVGARYA